MNLLQTAYATFILAARRIWNYRSLMACLLIGLIAAVGLLSSIPMYSDAINNKLLQGELDDDGATLPPFAFVWRYIGAFDGDIDAPTYAPINTYLSEQAPAIIDLPSELQVRHLRTATLRLFPDPDAQTFINDEPLLFTSVGFLTDLEEHIVVTEGNFPSASAETDLPVLLSQTLADKLGFQVGERYIIFGQGSSGVQIPVQIVGIWQAQSVADPYWFYQPSAFDEVLLTTEAAFDSHVMPALEEPISQAVWFQLFDGGRVRPNTVPSLLQNIATVETRVNALLNGTTLDTSPKPALENYGDSARLLTVLLTIFAIPIVGLILYFISLIASMVVQRGQNEIAVLRSRGTTRQQIVLVYLLEGVIIGVIGLTLGLLLGRGLAGIMSRTETFLTLNASAESLPILISSQAVQYGLIGVGLSLLALLIPATWSSRFTIVSFKAQRARSMQKPLWQRYFLDLLLLLLPLYGWYLLRQQGTISALSSGDDLFSNPLLFLVPALFCFSLSLLFIRFFPHLLSLLAYSAEHFPGVVGLLTLRQLARAASQYTGSLVLIALTLSLATFTASMALTLDDHLIDQAYYAVGADLNLAELGENTEEAEQATLPGQEPPPPPEPDENEPRFLFLPVEEHLIVPGVNAVARVGSYDATSNIGGRQTSGQLLGIDRIDFPRVAFWRTDFNSAESLGDLMNRIAASRDNILVSRDFLERRNLKVGDPIKLTIAAAGDFAEIEFKVAGAIDLFPGYYPSEGPLFVANLDFVHEGFGGQYPYSVWIDSDPSYPSAQIVAGVRQLGISVVTSQDATDRIAAEQQRPERQGVFGLLSVGFFAAAALTVLGFLVYAVVSFQRRFIELGMLRAIGLSINQMVGYLAGEQALLILTGMGLGTAIGILASIIFIPYLQIGVDANAAYPPFIVQIAWQQIATIYAVFAAMFVLAVGVLMVLLVRMNIFEAVKLGETV